MNDVLFRRLLAVVFTASGFSALVYQVAWQRVLTQAIGSDAISVVLVVSAFMAFLGVGAELARRLLRRRSKNIVLFYAGIEAAVGIYGLFSVHLIRSINAAWGGVGYNSLVLDSLLNLSALALPVIGMGMTTPLIVQCAKRRLDDLGRMVGLYYGLNILGAAMGAIVAGLVLIELLGLFGTTVVAAAINIAIAVTLFIYLREGELPTLFESDGAERPRFGAKLSLVAIGFGFCTLAVQIGLFRVLSNYFTMSTVVFPVVLCVYLILMAAGQWFGGRLADKHADRLPWVIAWLFAAGTLALTTALSFPPAWAASIGALRFTTFNGGLVGDGYYNLIGDPNPLVVFAFSAFVLLVVLFWSSLFPVALKLATHKADDAGEQFARLYMLYTVGNVLGTAIFGLVVVPLIGTGSALTLTVFVGLVAVVLLSEPGQRSYVPLATAGLLAALIPQDYYKKFHLGGYAVSEVYEGVTGVATTAESSRFYTIVDMNRTASASAIVRDPQEGDFYEAWRWNLTDIMALDPGFRPRDILVIGIGHAYLIDAILDLPFVESIVVVDISSEVVDAVRNNTRTSTARIFTDPRVEIVIADGRRFVQQAISKKMKFDLVQTKINEPWHAGSGNLFTVEFFALKKALLRDGGYLGVRPLAGHVKDGLQVFPTAVFPGEYHVYFRNGPMQAPTKAIITPDIEDLWFRLLPGRAKRGERADTLSVAFFDSAEAFDSVAQNTDDWPSFEYYYLRRLFGVWDSPRTGLASNDYDAWRTQVPVVFADGD